MIIFIFTFVHPCTYHDYQKIHHPMVVYALFSNDEEYRPRAAEVDDKRVI